MMKRYTKLILFTLVAFVFLASCKKDEYIGDNNAPYYDGIPTVKVENYVNRLFIDLLGREPLDTEMAAEVATLKANKLSFEARESLITRLQTDTNFVAGDSSYFIAYHVRLYNLFKFRLLEGASDSEIDFYLGLAQNDVNADSIGGDSLSMQMAKMRVTRLKAVKNIPFDYRKGVIDIRTVYARLLYNDVYDFINMNSFNFVRASFNDLFARFPTDNEFNSAYAMVESNTPNILFGQPGQNKGDMVQILINSNEFKEGLIRWCYKTFLAREAETNEVYGLITDFNTTLDFQKLQREILKTDEYANFN